MPIVSRLMREPLLHFLAIGVALFGAYALLRPDAGEDPGRRRIDVTAAEIGWLKGNFQARWQRPPTFKELRGLVDSFVRQEMLYREALDAGLDRNDDVIRRRMVQKIEFMTQDLAAQETPSQVRLEAYFRENADRYRIPEQRRFRQIYFNVDRRGRKADEAARRLLAELHASSSSDLSTAGLGDRFLLEYDDRLRSEQEVERLFGPRFATALFRLEPGGGWHGPIRSSYGLHLVRVTEVRGGRRPELAAVKNAVLRDYATAARERVRDAMDSSLKKRYEVTIDEAAIRALSLPETPPARSP